MGGLIGGKWLYSAPLVRADFETSTQAGDQRKRNKGTPSRPRQAAPLRSCADSDRPPARTPHQSSTTLLSIVVNFLKLSYLDKKISKDSTTDHTPSTIHLPPTPATPRALSLPSAQLRATAGLFNSAQAGCQPNPPRLPSSNLSLSYQS